MGVVIPYNASKIQQTFAVFDPIICANQQRMEDSLPGPIGVLAQLPVVRAHEHKQGSLIRPTSMGRSVAAYSLDRVQTHCLASAAVIAWDRPSTLHRAIRRNHVP